MSQNPIYIASGGKRNNRTLEEARSAEKKLALVGTKSLGIVAEGNGGQRVNEEDFEANDIDPALPANYLIRTSFGDGPDKDAEGNEIENSVSDQGEFQSVDKVLDAMESASDPIAGLKRLYGMTHVGVKDDELSVRIDNLPGVREAVNEARNKAITKLWNDAK